MDGVSALSSAAATAAGGTSAIALSVLKSTQNLMADEAARLFASLGLGSQIDTAA